MSRRREPIDLKEFYGEEGFKAFKKNLDYWFQHIVFPAGPEGRREPPQEAEIIDLKTRRKPD